MYLLDTNVVSELRKIQSKHSAFNDWYKTIDPQTCYLSSLTIFEIRKGILLKSLKDPQQAEILQHWFNERLIPHFHGRVLDFTADMAEIMAKLHVPNPAPFADSIIASTALYYDLTVITRNIQDFQNLGVKLINPFEYH